jgi:hypothetical protein
MPAIPVNYTEIHHFQGHDLQGTYDCSLQPVLSGNNCPFPIRWLCVKLWRYQGEQIGGCENILNFVKRDVVLGHPVIIAASTASECATVFPTLFSSDDRSAG